LQLKPEALRNQVWLSKDECGKTTLHMAAGDHAEFLEKLWYWAWELQLTPEELRDQVWLSKLTSADTASLMAARGTQVKLLEKLWDLAK
jgi:hypothetical protein